MRSGTHESFSDFSHLVQVWLCPAFSSLRQLYYLKGVGLGIMLASYVLSLANSRVSCLPLPFPRCGEQKNIDTHPFREAIWYYIHSIKGIRHDDYHYRKVSAHLHHHWVETISIALLSLEVPVTKLLVKSLQRRVRYSSTHVVRLRPRRFVILCL